MQAAGIKNVVAACGTAFTSDHIAVLKKHGVRRLNLLFDGDPAGIRAAQKAVTLAYKEEMTAYVYHIPEGKDPDDFFRAGGDIKELVAISGLEFLDKTGIEMTYTMRELYRLESLEVRA